MSRTLIGERKKKYQKNAVFRLAYYECAIADIRTCVEHLFHKDLGNGTIAVFGSYLVFILFKRTDSSGKILCFHTVIHHSFCILLEDGVPDADAVDINFHPEVSYTCDPHAIDWEIKITAEVKASFFTDSEKEQANGEVPSEEELPSSHVRPKADSDENQDTPLPSASPEETHTYPDAGDGLPGEDASHKIWKIKPNVSVSVEELLDMDEDNRNLFIEKKTVTTS